MTCKSLIITLYFTFKSLSIIITTPHCAFNNFPQHLHDYYARARRKIQLNSRGSCFFMNEIHVPQDHAQSQVNHQNRFSLLSVHQLSQ